MLPKLLKLSLTILLQILVASASKWDLKMSLRELISGHCHVVTPRVCRRYTGFDSDFTCGFILRHVCTNAYTGEQSLKMLTNTDVNVHITPLPRTLSFYDVNEDNQISLNEFARTLGHSPRDLHVKVAFRAADKNGDGTVSFREFQTTDAWVFERRHFQPQHTPIKQHPMKPKRQQNTRHQKIHATTAYVGSDESDDASAEFKKSSNQIDSHESYEEYDDSFYDDSEMHEDIDSHGSNEHRVHLPGSGEVDSRERGETSHEDEGNSHDIDSHEIGENSHEVEWNSHEAEVDSHEKEENSHEAKDNSYEDEMQSHEIGQNSHEVEKNSHSVEVKENSHESEIEGDSREFESDSHEHEDESKEARGHPFTKGGKSSSTERSLEHEYEDSEEYEDSTEHGYEDSTEQEYEDSTEHEYEDSEHEYEDSTEHEYKDSEEYEYSTEHKYADSEEYKDSEEYEDSIESKSSKEDKKEKRLVSMETDEIDSESEEDYQDDSREIDDSKDDDTKKANLVPKRR
ncbi:protein starmaker [Magallana gigas]|uniref:protein starmaker n=1 Tax=Magallana gigas TaxID=29159 RepID=UPI00333E404D